MINIYIRLLMVDNNSPSLIYFVIVVNTSTVLSFKIITLNSFNVFAFINFKRSIFKN